MDRLNIVVTGGAGFIGTNFLLQLRRKYNGAFIRSIDIRQPTYPVEGVAYEMVDVRNAAQLETAVAKADKIFHLAAIIGTHESIESPYVAFDTNVQGTINVLDGARKHGIEVFIAGMPGIWNNPYSISKDAAVRMATTYFETYGVKVSVLRWYSVYGPYQYLSRYNKAVPTFVNKALRNEPLPIYGDGEQVADYLYSEDAVAYAIGMLEKQQWGRVVQCASGDGISVNELVKMIVGMTGSKSQLKHLPMRKGEPAGAYVVADNKELKQIFPDYSPVNLKDGLTQTIEYYSSHPALD